MASRDELIYHVVFRPDSESYQKAKSLIDDLEKAREGGGSQKASKANKEFSASQAEMNEVTGEGIDRLIELQERIDSYRVTLKEIRDAKKKDIQVSRETRGAEAQTAAALKDTSQEYRNQQADFIAQQAAADSQVATYRQLSAENRVLKAAMQDLPLNDTSGQLEDLKKRWTANNETLKEFDASMGDHRRNVGNYSEAMTTASAAVAAIQGPLGPIAGRISSINTVIRRAVPLLNAKAGAWVVLRRAMIFTGVGAIIVFLGAVLAAMSKLQPVMDRITRRVEQLSAAWGNFTDLVGSWLGMNERTNVSMKESIRLASEMHDRKIQLQEDEIRSITILADLEKRTAILRREAEDEVNTHRDRIRMMEEAMQLVEDRYDLEIYLQREKIDQMEEEIDWAVSSREEEEELQKAIAEGIRLVAQRETQLRQLTRRRQSIINSLEVEEKTRERLIQRMREQTMEALRGSERRIEQMRIEAEELISNQRLDRRIELLRRTGQEMEALALESARREQEAFKDAEEEKTEARARQADLQETIIKKLEAEGVDTAEAEARASVQAREVTAREIEAIEEKLNQMLLAIQENEMIALNDLMAKKEDARRAAARTISDLEEQAQSREIARGLAGQSLLEERMIRLKQDQHRRELDLRREFLDLEFSQEQASRMARRQAELEFEEDLQQAKTDIQAKSLQTRMELQEAQSQAAIQSMRIFFGDSKGIQIAQATIDAYTAANRALASAPPPVGTWRAAAAIAQGLANVRQIMQTDIGSSSSGASRATGGGGAPVDRVFEVTGRPGMEDSDIARRVAEQSRSESQDMNPVFVFQGDLRPEVMAMKVREGNRQINTKTYTVKSRPEV